MTKKRQGTTTPYPYKQVRRSRTASAARESQYASLLSLIRQVHDQRFPFSVVNKNGVKLKYYKHPAHGHTIRVNQLPRDGGATLEQLKSMK